MEKSASYTTLVLQLIDKIRTFRPSNKYIQKAEKERLGLDVLMTKDSEKENENLERIRGEKEKKWEKMTPEQKKKQQEIEEKRFKKKFMKKVK